MLDPWSHIASLGVKHYHWNDPVFFEGNIKCQFLRKVPCVELDDESELPDSDLIITCHVKGCNKTFTTVADHAAHQSVCHKHMCVTCNRSLPSYHLLDLHIQENHDSLFTVMAAKKPMYQCYVETCKSKFMDGVARKEHCMKEHGFPHDYRYDLNWRSYCDLRPKSKASQKKKDDSSFNTLMDCDEVTTDKFDATAGSSKMLRSTDLKNSKRVPFALSFGSGVPRGFHRNRRGRSNRGRGGGPHWHQHSCPPNQTSVNIEEVNMKELGDALSQETNDS